MPSCSHQFKWLKRCILLQGLLLLAMVAGCSMQSSMQPPKDWRESQWPLEAMTAQLDAHAIVPASTSNQPALLQVAICYGHMLSNHACLRLQGPETQSLFWDPGGGYALDEGHRQGDLLLDDHAITLAELWQYRSVGCDEPTMLVFEWSLSANEAATMRRVLVNGNDKDAPGGAFDNATAGGWCCVNLSRFLKNFSPRHETLPRKWFWPHNLARQLWKHEPDRVWKLDRKQGLSIYTPPADHALPIVADR